MASIAGFSIPAESFALGETLPAYPDVTVEADRIAAHSPGTTMPCIWATDTDAPEFADAMIEDETVDEILGSVAFDDEHLYHVAWSDEIEQFVREMVEHAGVVLEASGRGERWLLRIRFLTHRRFDEFRTQFTGEQSGFQLGQFFSVQHPRHTHGDHTPEQYEALTTAAELGYFSVPTEASIQEVANELGISHQAVSERLRRGIENVVRDIPTVEPIRDWQ